MNIHIYIYVYIHIIINVNDSWSKVQQALKAMLPGGLLEVQTLFASKTQQGAPKL